MEKRINEDKNSMKYLSEIKALMVALVELHGQNPPSWKEFQEWLHSIPLEESPPFNGTINVLELDNTDTVAERTGISVQSTLIVDKINYNLSCIVHSRKAQAYKNNCQEFRELLSKGIEEILA